MSQIVYGTLIRVIAVLLLISLILIIYKYKRVRLYEVNKGFKFDKYVISELEKIEKEIYKCRKNCKKFEKKNKNNKDLVHDNDIKFCKELLGLLQKDLVLRQSIVIGEEGEKNISSCKELIKKIDDYIEYGKVPDESLVKY